MIFNSVLKIFQQYKFMRFIVSGGVNTLVYVTAYFILRLFFDQVVCVIISYFISVVVSFFLHRDHTFRSSSRSFNTIVRFIFIQGMMLLIMVSIPKTLEIISITDDIYIVAITIIIVPIFSYLAHNFWVFRE